MELTAQREKLYFTNRVNGNHVFMLLDKSIGKYKDDDNDPYILGSAFAEEIYYWKSQGKQVTVKINCPGGSVFDGWSMVDAIMQNGANTENIGIAYSMGGICLMAGKHRTAYNFSRIMVHAPRGGSKNHLEVVKGQFRDLLESRTKFSKAEIDEMIDSGKDYFFTPAEALQKGIIDEIIDTGKTFNFSQEQLCNTRALYLVYNNAFHESNQNNTDMDFKSIIAKLTGKTDEAEGIVAVTEMKSQLTKLEAAQASWVTEKAALQAKITELENAGKVSEAKTKAIALIEGAIAAGKMTFKTDAEKAQAIEGATANYDFTKSLIDKMPSGKTAAAVSIPDTGGDQTKNTYEWLMKNDPKKLQAIAETDEQLFNKLSDEYVESQKTKNEAQ